MATRVDRQTVDLSSFPDLVVIYVGMRVNRWFGLRTLFGYGRQMIASAESMPDGLLLHEPIIYSMMPMNVGVRQYWRDIDSLLAYTRSESHRQWWKNFLRESGGTGIWHETYLKQGEMEGVYDDVPKPIGFLQFAPVQAARGHMFSSSRRLGRSDPAAGALAEDDLYEPREAP